MNVYTISLDPLSKERGQPQFVGRAMPGGDGVIVYGEFIALEVKCDNSTETQQCNGTLETVNAFPQ
jgi:hypothetical protein